MSAEILIEPKSTVLVRQQRVRVPITLVVDEPLKARGIHAEFRGAEETKAIYTTHNGKTTQTHTAVQHVDHVQREFALSGRERLGFFGNVADALATMMGGGEHDVLASGRYTFEVEVEVPTDAPGSFTGKKCRIYYELSAWVDVPAGRDVRAVCSFAVANLPHKPPPSELVRTRYPEDQGKGLLDSWFGPDVRVEAALGENVFRPGDAIEGVFRVDAPQPLECRRILGRLVGVERTEAGGHKDTHTHVGSPTILGTPGGIERSHKQDFQIPAFLDGPATNRGKLFSVEWFVQLELDVPWAKDPKIRVPITLLAE